jgi:uncharacterized protein (DUF3084 family)
MKFAGKPDTVDSPTTQIETGTPTNVRISWNGPSNQGSSITNWRINILNNNGVTYGTETASWASTVVSESSSASTHKYGKYLITIHRYSIHLID